MITDTQQESGQTRERRVTHTSAEDFLREIEALARQGWITSIVPPGFPMGLYDVVMASGHPRARVARAKADLPLCGPYTRAELLLLSFPELKERAMQEYGVTDRGFNGLIRKILKHQEEKQNERD